MSPTERSRSHPRPRAAVGASGRRRARNELTQLLMTEYAGALPPGQIVAAVTRASLVLRTASLGDLSTWVSLCEGLARRTLADRVAGTAR